MGKKRNKTKTPGSCSLVASSTVVPGAPPQPPLQTSSLDNRVSGDPPSLSCDEEPDDYSWFVSSLDDNIITAQAEHMFFSDIDKITKLLILGQDTQIKNLNTEAKTLHENISHQKDQLASQSSVNADLKRKLSSTQNIKNHLEQKLANMKKNEEFLKNQNKICLDRLAQISQIAKIEKENNQKLENEYFTQRSENADLNEKLVELELLRQLLNTKVRNLNKRISLQKDELSVQSSVNADLNQKLLSENTQFKLKEEENCRLFNKLEKIQGTLGLLLGFLFLGLVTRYLKK